MRALMHRRCGCGELFELPNLKARTTTCRACDRKRGAEAEVAVCRKLVAEPPLTVAELTGGIQPITGWHSFHLPFVPNLSQHLKVLDWEPEPKPWKPEAGALVRALGATWKLIKPADWPGPAWEASNANYRSYGIVLENEMEPAE